MTDHVTAIIAKLSQAQRDAVKASAVMLPRYRDMGLMEASLVRLKLAKLVPGGAVLTQLGRRVRTELRGARR